MEKRTNGDTRKTTDNTKGNWAEMSTDQFVLNNFKNRWKPLHEMIDNWQKKYGSGIDHIYKNLDFKPPMPPPPKYIIGESKSFTSTLSKGLKDGSDQMDAKWIEKRIEAILRNDKSLSRKEINELRADILENHKSILFEFKDVGAEPIITLLDKNAKKIEGIKKQKLY